MAISENNGGSLFNRILLESLRRFLSAETIIFDVVVLAENGDRFFYIFQKFLRWLIPVCIEDEGKHTSKTIVENFHQSIIGFEIKNRVLVVVVLIHQTK